MIPTLRPFQTDLYQRVCARVREGKRIIVIQGATGCGKNTIGAYFGRQAFDKGNPVLFMVHRRKLVDQISDRLRQFEVDHGVIMRGEAPYLSAIIQVASRDTLVSRCVRNEWIGMPHAKVIVVDEAHHASDPASDYRRVLNYYPEAIVLLLSATPVDRDGKGLGPWAQAIECAAPTTQLVRDGFLVPVRCYAPDRKTRGKKYVRGIAGDLVESWKSYGEDRPTVLFCGRVQHSLDAVAAYRANGVTAAHVDAETEDDERERIFEKLSSGEIKVLSNVGIIGEGVDIPELGCCQLFCEMGSRVRFLQACGRIMRPFDQKKYGILIDHSGAVFKHGFPDEDTEWTLEGNVDQEFKRKHEAGETDKAFYCKHCQVAYHGQQTCPQCGRMPVKPPRSIFAPPPVDGTNEILTEADRGTPKDQWSRDMKIKTWFASLSAAKKRNGTMGQAAHIYKGKYGEWPPDDFPLIPPRYRWKDKVADVFPDFGRKKEKAS